MFLIPCVIAERENNFICSLQERVCINLILAYIFRQELKIEFPQYQAYTDHASGIHQYPREAHKLLQRIQREDWSFQHRMALGQFKSNGIPISELEPRAIPTRN